MITEVLSRLNSNGTGLNLREMAQTLVTAELSATRDIQETRIAADRLRLKALEDIRAQFTRLGEAMALAVSEPVLAVETTTASILPAVTDRNLLQTGVAEIEVAGLAQRQVLEFAGFTAADAALETGTLTVEFGSWSTGTTAVFSPDGGRATATLNIAAGSTLRDLATALSQVTGVTARVLTKGDGTYSLGIVGETGEMNALRLTAAGTGGGGPTLLAGFDTTATNATRQVQAATNARVVVDGIAISRTTNVLDDVLPGMSITLSAVVDGTITVARDSGVAQTAITGLIDGLNATLSVLRAVTDRGVNGGLRGDLAGDRNIEAIGDAIRRVIAGPIRGYGDNPIYLADLGIGTQRDGTLYFDATVFGRAFAANAGHFDALLGDSLQSLTEGVTVGGLPLSFLPGGDYSLAVAPDGSATLDGWQMLGIDNGNGTFSYTALDGPMQGLTVTADAGITEATIRFGRSFVAQLAAVVNDLSGSRGAIGQSEREIGRSTDAASERLAALEARASLLERRYLTRFALMEQMVTQMKSTGNYISNLVDQWNADR